MHVIPDYTPVPVITDGRGPSLTWAEYSLEHIEIITVVSFANLHTGVHPTSTGMAGVTGRCDVRSDNRRTKGQQLKHEMTTSTAEK